MAPRYGLVGGTTLRSLGDHPLRVETPRGPADLSHASGPDHDLVFLERHAVAGGRAPAHRVPHGRNALALERAGVDAVLGVHTVGALSPDLTPGDLVAPDDLVDASGDPPSLHEEAVVHVSMDPPFCPRVRRAALAPEDVVPAGAYVQTRGPRLETPAEVEILREAGDVVGMTAAAEAAAAREVGLCYASLALVANPAPGLGDGVDAGDVADAAAAAGDRVRRAAEAALAAVEGEACSCREAPERGRLR